jgi:hypothetical protein
MNLTRMRDPRYLPDEPVNADQFCSLYEYLDPDGDDARWHGARTVVLERCIAQHAPELAAALDVTDVHRVVQNLTPHLLELGRRS